jgi:hypothetical protein
MAVSNASVGIRTHSPSYQAFDRLERHAVFGIAKKDHLFQFDHSERVVLDDDDLDRQPILHRGGKFAHEHGEAAVADECDRLTARISHLRCDGIRQPGRHGGQIAGTREQLAAFDADISRDPPRGDAIQKFDALELLIVDIADRAGHRGIDRRPG